MLLALLAACGEPEPETKIVTETVTNTVTSEVTNTVVETKTIVEDVLEPGRFEPPLVMQMKVLGDDGAVGTSGALEDSMHLDELRYRASDARLFYCSYTFGVVDASDPLDPEYLAQGYEWDFDGPTGRATGCLHLDWDDADPDIVYVSHRGNYDFGPHLSVVDLNSFAPDPEEPDELELDPILGPSLVEPGVSYEGLDYANGYVYVALHGGGVGVFERDPATNAMTRIGGHDTIVENAYDIQVVGTTAYVVDELAGLVILDVTDPNAITKLGELFVGGVDRDLQVSGDHVYIAAGGAGLAIVDVSDPTSPVLASLTPTHGTAIRVGTDGERAAVAAWNDTRVYDVADPSAPAMIGATRITQDMDYSGADAAERPDITARTFGVDVYGDELFVGNWNTPYTFEIHDDRVAPYVVLPEDIHYMGFGTVELGATGTYVVDVENHGTAPLTIYDTWVSNASFAVSPRQVEIPVGGEASLTITYTPSTVEEETGILTILTDDPDQQVRQGYVVGNSPLVGVGDPFPYTEATDVESGLTWTTDDWAGQVTLVAYFATF